MNIENFCCAAAELQNKMTQTTKMSQIYYYRAFGEETRSDFLSDGFFNQAQERVKVNDIIIGYYPDDEDNTLICWLKVTSNFGGKVTVEPFIADATLKEYVDSITPPLEDIFYATYGETTYSEITNALDDEKTVFCKYTVGQDVYNAVFVASQNGLYQFTHSIAYLDGGEIASNIQTFSVDTNDDWTTDSMYLQEKLISGTNIKTVNNTTILGQGNIDVGTVKSVNNTNPDANGNVQIEVNNAKLTISQNGEIAGTFTANASSDVEIDLSGGAGGLEIGDIGIAPLGIDETENKRRYLNGQVISQAQFVSFTDKLKDIVALYPSLSTTEVNWQAEVTNSALGQCGKFVIDDDAGTIRLPKVVNINGLQDLTGLGTIKAESLPNITGHLSVGGNTGFYGNASTTGAFTLDTSGSYTTVPNTSSSTGYPAYFSASRVSTTYQDDAPVQQEAVQYPYFIQVATGVETSVDVSREIELNNPFSLLDYKFSEYELSNASWLRSNGQYNSGATYSAVYNLLLQIYNGTVTKAGVSVKLSTEAYEDTDFVLNTTDTTFRLPTVVKLASGKAVVGNGMTLGLTDGTNNFGLSTGLWNGQDSICNGLSPINYGKTVGSVSSNIATFSNGTAIGVTTDETKSGIETSANGLYLYFYVGETVQDANIIAAAGVLTDVADLKNASNFSQTGLSTLSGLGMPSGTFETLTLGASGSTYTAPANGYFLLYAEYASGYRAYFDIYVSGSNLGCTHQFYWGAFEDHGRCFIPVLKGQTITFITNGTFTNVDFRFIYAKGSEWEKI